MKLRIMRYFILIRKEIRYYVEKQKYKNYIYKYKK